MHQLKNFLLLVAACLMSLAACGAEDFSREKGYVDFGNLTGVYGKPRVQINLGTAMLAFVSAAAEDEDKEVADLLSKLKQIRVLVYDIANNLDDALSAVDKVTADIEKAGWETIVSVDEDREKARIYMKMSGNVIDGLVVMAVDESGFEGDEAEAVFINIIGALDPKQVGRVMNSLDIDVDITP